MKSVSIIFVLIVISLPIKVSAQFRNLQHPDCIDDFATRTFKVGYIPDRINFRSTLLLPDGVCQNVSRTDSVNNPISHPTKNDLSIVTDTVRRYYQSITSTPKDGLIEMASKPLEDELVSSTKWKNDFVFWAAKGQLFSLAHQFEKGNECYEKAYLLRVDKGIYSKKKIDESFDELREVLMLLYLKALNYLELGDLEGAMVECKRMDEWLMPRNANDTARRLVAKDPLFHVLMGLIFELDHNYCNASISFHKAEYLFKKAYKDLLSKAEPQQLKESLYEADYLSSTDEPRYKSEEKNSGQLIFIWNNGQCPKELVADRAFSVSINQENYRSTDSRVKIFTDCIDDTLFSFYQFSNPIYHSCTLWHNGNVTRCEQLEDVSWFTVRFLQDRLKMNIKHIWHQGMNWNTMPGKIYFAIVPLVPGENQFLFVSHGNHGLSKTETFTFKGDGKFHFHMINSPESVPLKVDGQEIMIEDNMNWLNGK